jgi:hypothetical protein
MRRKVAWSAGILLLATVITTAALWRVPISPQTPSQPRTQGTASMAAPAAAPVVPAADAESPLDIELNVNSSFGQIQNAMSGAATDSYFIHQEIDAWDRELQSLRRDVERIEANR